MREDMVIGYFLWSRSRARGRRLLSVGNKRNFRKLSNFSKNLDWGRDCNNYVAKRYMEEVERKVYFDDVKLQMDAKLWSKL